MKLLTLTLITLAASCSGPVTREDGRNSTGISKVNALQMEDFEQAANTLVTTMLNRGTFSGKPNVLFRLLPNGNRYTGLVNKSSDKFDQNGFDRLLYKFVQNHLIAAKACDFVEDDNQADYGIRILLTNEYVTEDNEWYKFKADKQSNRILMQFEVWDLTPYAQKLVFSDSALVQKNRNR